MSGPLRRRLTEIRDLLNTHLNRMMNQEIPEEGEALQQRVQMFPRQAGAPGPIRRGRRATPRRRMVTFRVSVLRSSEVQRYRSTRDGTPPQRVVVPLDLDSAGFLHALRTQIPDLPTEFELCRVNGQRCVTPLEVTNPREIRETNALGRSALYIRPKAPQAVPDPHPDLQNPEPQTSSGHAAGSGRPDPVQSTVEHPEPQTSSGHAAGSGRPDPVQSTGEHPEPQASTQDLWIVDVESEMSDIEEVLPSSPQANSPDQTRSLVEILKNFSSDNIDETQTLTIIVRRSRILQSACMALAKPYFVWHKVPQIEFVGEMAEDFGGPRREFFRLVLIEIQSSMGVFEGRPGDLLFSYNQQALTQRKYYTAGRLTAWAIVHNGPGLRCLNKQLFLLMCGQRPDLRSFPLEVLIEEDVISNIEKVQSCVTEAQLSDLKATTGDWIASCGVPGIYTASLRDLPEVHGQIVAHFVYHRVASMIQQFIAGVNSCGGLWNMVEAFWPQFQPLFTSDSPKLTRNSFHGLFDIEWSDAGSNNRELEEATIFLWEWWLMEIQEGQTDIKFEDLLVFVTGADSIPPLGFPRRCSINFYSQEPGTRRMPHASTCSLTLSLPRGVEEEEEFRELMDTALKGSLGFGKI